MFLMMMASGLDPCRAVEGGASTVNASTINGSTGISSAVNQVPATRDEL